MPTKEPSASSAALRNAAPRRVKAGPAPTHTSVALRDALAGVAMPFIEVHRPNARRRQPFGHPAYFSDTVGTIAGLGSRGYDFALAYALSRFEE